MQRTIRVSLAVGIGALALAAAGLQSAKAADVGVPQYQAPPPAAYAPPPPAYAYAPPVAYYYPPSPYVVWPGPYYGRYWHYGPHFAYGYGRWAYGHWGHGWHR